MIDEKRMVLEFAQGTMTFRNFAHEASYGQLLRLAEAINKLQADKAERVLLVTAVRF